MIPNEDIRNTDHCSVNVFNETNDCASSDSAISSVIPRTFCNSIKSARSESVLELKIIDNNQPSPGKCSSVCLRKTLQLNTCTPSHRCSTSSISLNNKIRSSTKVGNIVQNGGNYSATDLVSQCGDFVFQETNDHISGTNYTDCLSETNAIHGHNMDSALSTSLLGTSPVLQQQAPESVSGRHSCLCCCFSSRVCKYFKSTLFDSNTCTVMSRGTPSTFTRCFCFDNFSRRRLPNANLLTLSIIQLLCGFAAIFLSTVAVTKAVFLYQMATGLWAGILMLITGFHGLFTSRRPIICMMLTLLVLSMLVSLVTCVLICVSVAGTIEDGILNKGELRGGHIKISIFQKNASVIRQPDHESNYVLDNHSIVFVTRSPRMQDLGEVRRTSIKYTYSESPDSYSRTCKIILHLLLLVVGILEASVSLATSILCCRCFCSNCANLPFQNSRSLRTNIVSFDVETANQAVSVLRSGAINNFIGRGNVLLAVDANTPLQQASLDNKRQSVKPKIHHTLLPFLPELNQHALILTQAESGSVALAAAYAAANLIGNRGTESQPTSTPLSTTSLNEGRRPVNRPLRFLKRVWNGRNRMLRLGHPNQAGRPRLLYTSFNVPSTRSNTSANLMPFTQCSTLVYVVPSPTREEPAVIFPPFPPSYESHKKSNSLCPSHPRLSHMTNRPTCPMRRRNRPRGLLSTTRPFSVRNIPPTFSRCVPRSNNVNRRSSMNTRSAPYTTTGPSFASTPIVAGDRLIQPVLIVGDRDIATSGRNEDTPPPYSM